MVGKSERMASRKQEFRVDVLLVTATEVETEAVLCLFQEEFGEQPKPSLIRDKMYFELGILGNASIFLVPSAMSTMGRMEATLFVHDAITVLAPSAVIFVGVAFGLFPEKQNIGDILISQQLVGYEMITNAADRKGEIQARGDSLLASSRLLDRFRAGVFDWKGPKVYFGPILSGDKLIANSDGRKKLISLVPEALGVEMEDTGLYSAAYREKVDWILVKAIGDWADDGKSLNKDKNMKLAADNAVQFTMHVLNQLGFVADIAGISDYPPITNQQSSSPPLERGTLLHKYDVHASWVVTVDWESNGTRIASAGGDGTVRIWDAETGESLLTYRDHAHWLNVANVQATIYTVAWAPEGLRIASAGHGTNVHVWNAATGQTLTRYQGHSGLLPDIFAVAWSPDGKRIASACSGIGLDKTLHLWDAMTGQTLDRYNIPSGYTPNFSVSSVAWSPDGKRIAVGCADKTIRVWNTETGRLFSTYRSGEWGYIAWSPDSRYLAAAHSDRTAQVWDISTGQIVTTYREHTDALRHIAWSPDGTTLATASNDRTVHLWEPLTGKPIYIYRGHSNWTTSVAWSPDGTRIASASNDKTIHIWQAL